MRPGDPTRRSKRGARAIGDYFSIIVAPEILNRIGDNIVVFNFITPEVAGQIFDGMLRNVARRLADELGLTLTLADDARSALLARCTRDLANGGRGIGNQLESGFVNPLSRALFEHDIEGRRSVTVTALGEADQVVTLTLELA